MDNLQFDHLARSVARSGTRRSFLAAVAGLAATVLKGDRGAAQAACPPGQAANRKGDCRCPAGTTACPTGCFDRNRDMNNCGACGIACQGGASCIKGQCRCPSGTAPCAGACRNQSSFVDDPDNCGSCGAACPSAAPGTCQGERICTNGQCGFAPAPDGTECNADGDACTAGDLCQAGTCIAGLPQDCPSCQACARGACSPVLTDARCATVCCDGVCCPDGQTCAGGVCQAICVPFGDACEPASGTCCQDEPSACVQTCGDVPTCCHPPGGTCGNNCDCCGLDTCDFDRNVCCRELGGSCAAGEPCCGVLPCVGGVCCQEAGGGGCDADIDCCGDLVCREGVCEAAICLPPQSLCNPVENACCQVGGYASCQEAVGCGEGEPTCCRDLGGACTADCDCCGAFDGCGADGRCCRGLGGACSEVTACCPGFVCDAAAGETCRLPDGAFCAFDDECRAGARCVDNACQSAV